MFSLTRLWLLGVVLIGAHLGITLGRAARVGARGAMMPAAGSALEQLAIQFHRVQAKRFLEVYEALFAALDPAVTVWVVVGDEEDRAMFETARRAWRPGPKVEYVVVNDAITSWSRDRMAVLGEGPTTLLVPPRPMRGPDARLRDWIVPWDLRRALGPNFRVDVAPFQFEGGDLIANERTVFVATPLLERNPDRDPEEVLADIARVTGREVVRIGDSKTQVPNHHIGMFLTPLPDGRVAYGDPDLGLQLVDGTPEMDGVPFEIDRREERLERFRNVGRLLRAAGFETVALPILPGTERFAFVSYNNVMMEHRGGRLHVYLPTYGLEALDRAATDIYQAQGALVHPIRVDRLFRLGGSVRCLTTPLVRSG